MSTPHTCPTCAGSKEAPNPRTREIGPCPTCGATGVVWEGNSSPEEAAVGSDPHEINGL